MPFDDAHERIDAAWKSMVVEQANTDAAIADKRWSDAENHAQKLRWACSDLEHALALIRSLES